MYNFIQVYITKLSDRKTLLEWTNVAYSFIDIKTDNLYKKEVKKEFARYMDNYRFWKKIFPWIKEPTISLAEESLRKENSLGIAEEDFIYSYYSQNQNCVDDIYALCVSSNNDKIFLDVRTVRLGMMNLGYLDWIRNRNSNK